MNRIMLFGTIFNSARMLVGAFSVVFLLKNGLNIFEIGILKTLQAVVIFIFDMPVSYFSDKYSRKLSIIIAILFSITWLILTGMRINKYFYYFAEIMNAFSIVFFNSSYGAYLISNLKENDVEDIQKITSKTYKIQFFFMGVAALLGSFFTSVSSSVIWFLSAIILIVLCILTVVFLPKDSKEKDEKANISLVEIKMTLKNFFMNKKNSNILGIYLLLNIFFQVLIQFWQPLCQQLIVLKCINNENARFFGFIFILILIAQSIASAISEKMPIRKFTLNLSTIFSFCCILAFGISIFFMNNMIVVAVILLFFYTRLFSIVTQSIILSQSKECLRATTIAALMTVVRIGVFLTLPALGFLINYYDWTILFYTFLTITIVMFVLNMQCREKTLNSTVAIYPQ